LVADLPVEEVLHPENRGYGAALLSGYRWILDRETGPASVVVSLDADGTHGPEYILSLVSKVREGWDIVTASYTMAGGAVTGVPLYRALLSRMVNGLFWLFCRVPGAYTYSNGFRAYRLGALQRAEERFGKSLIEETGFAGGAELFLRAAACGGRAAEVPFVLRYERRGKNSKIRFIPTILGYLRLIARARSWRC
jgi:dolichol-phosphate mannosyltransferase